MFASYCRVGSNFRETSNISETCAGNRIVDHSWCSWSIACRSRRCSNCIFILDLTHGFNGLGKDDKYLSFGIGALILEVLRYTVFHGVIIPFFFWVYDVAWWSRLICLVGCRVLIESSHITGMGDFQHNGVSGVSL